MLLYALGITSFSIAVFMKYRDGSNQSQILVLIVKVASNPLVAERPSGTDYSSDKLVE
jgi:hypothetical protein